MKTIYDIFKLIKSENILLEEDKSLKFSKGIYLNIPGLLNNPVIGVSPSLASIKNYKSILAEELGHHFTTNKNLILTSKSYSEKIEKSKQELKARAWGANYLVADDEFLSALNNCITSIYDMSEYFDVTEETIKHKIETIVCNENLYKYIKNNFKNEVAYECCNI